MSEAPGKVSSIVITIYRDLSRNSRIYFLKNQVSIFLLQMVKILLFIRISASDPRDDDLSHHEEKSCHLDFVIETCTAMIGTRPFLPSF